MWIQGFLLFRRQQVRVNSKYSYFTSVLSGIPQGSIRGPLLFVIYINDLPSAVMDVVNTVFFYLLLMQNYSNMYKYYLIKTNSKRLSTC